MREKNKARMLKDSVYKRTVIYMKCIMSFLLFSFDALHNAVLHLCALTWLNIL